MPSCQHPRGLTIFINFGLTDLDQRSHTSYTARVMVSSAVELQLGYLGFCRSHTQKQTQPKCVHDLWAPCCLSRMFIFMLRHSRCKWHTHLTIESVIMITGKPWIPQIGAPAPCHEENDANFWISGLNTWSDYNFYLALSEGVINLIISSAVQRIHTMQKPTILSMNYHSRYMQ